MNWHVPRKADGRLDFSPKRHHGFSFFIMILGWILPPLAVAVRFGIGKDFFINVVCTICGYIPGHGHNFFIQNIRNNEHRNRTPKWAKRYGLVNDQADKELAKRRAWTGRYDEHGGDRRMYDDEGNVYTYDRNHKFGDGDPAANSRTTTAPRRKANGSQDGLDRYYEQPSADGGLRRSKSRSSIRSFGRNSSAGGNDDMLPGSAEAERRRAKSKTRNLNILGSRKSKADRHERSQNVMHNSSDYNRRNPYDDESFDSLPGRSNGARRDSYEGPENVEDSVAKRYGKTNGHASGAYDAKVLPQAPSNKPAPVVDIMNDNHEF